MAQIDTLISDVAGRFDLGTSASSIVREVLKLITGSPGGMGGFLDRFISAGLGPEVKSWLGHPDAAPLQAAQVDQVLGSKTLGKIAANLGMGSSAVSMMAGYTIPKLIGTLTPGGIIPSKLSPDIMGFLSRPTRATEQVRPLHVDVIHDEPVTGRWLWPLLAGLAAALLVGFYLFWQRPIVSPVAIQTPATVPAPLAQPRLTLSNESGVIHYTGVVHDGGVRASIMNALTAAFGTSKIEGGIDIDSHRGGALWTAGNLRTAFNSLKTPGMRAVFDGNLFALGGVGVSERDTIFATMKRLFGSGMTLGTLDDLVSSVNNNVVAALDTLKSDVNTQDLTAVLNQSIINFPSGQAEVPAGASGLLQSAAAQIKQLPSNTILEISGHTDNVGDSAANMKLSQQRADAVRSDLVRYGVRESVLVAKGYGDAKPLASNDTAEGRFRNRRIEYHVLQP